MKLKFWATDKTTHSTANVSVEGLGTSSWDVRGQDHHARAEQEAADRAKQIKGSNADVQ